MKELAFRLQRGTDLKAFIEQNCKDINVAVALSAVGCVYHCHFRLADASKYYENEADYEIVSLTGTVCDGKVHMHISLADNDGNVIGGHLMEGCLINTTCELVLGVLEEYEASRSFDDNTGYDEIEFKEKK